MNAGLIKFLLVIVVLVGLAVYYHYEGPRVEFSRTLFGQINSSQPVTLEISTTGAFKVSIHG